MRQRRCYKYLYRKGGYYPLDEQGQAEYEAWRKAKS